MNILYIAHEGGNDFNGASRSLLTIVKHFTAKNNVFVLIPQKGGKLEKELSMLNCTVIELPFYRWMMFRERKPWRWWKMKYNWKTFQLKENERIVNELAQYCIDHNIETPFSDFCGWCICVNNSTFSMYKSTPHISSQPKLNKLLRISVQFE